MVFLLDWNRRIDRTVLIASMGRSGSTLLADLVNADDAWRVLFEPFHAEKVPEARLFRYPLYLRPGERDPAYLEPAKRILAGQVRHPWIDGRGGRRLATRRIVKDIRVNFLLGWLADCFPALRIVLLVRRPGAVVSSWRDVGFGDGRVARARLLEQEMLLEDHLEPFRDAIEGAATPFDRLVCFWCAYNLVPLRQLGRGGLHVVLYENLVLDRHDEIERLFAFLDRPVPKRVREVLARPSATTAPGSVVRRNGDPVRSWKDRATAEERASERRILERFGMSELYGDDLLPDRAAWDGFPGG